jgi:hypothetical protein
MANCVISSTLFSFNFSMIGIPSRIFGWFSKFGQFFASHPNNAKIHSRDGCKLGTFSAILPEIDRKIKKCPFFGMGDLT